jgi:hypothetical protein
MAVAPQALGCAVASIHWAEDYLIVGVTGGPARSVILEVVSTHGGRFYVGSTPSGNTTQADEFARVLVWLVARTVEEQQV